LLYEVSTSIHAIRDLDKMLRDVLFKIRKVLDIEGASLALHDPKRKDFYFIRTVEEQRDGIHQEMESMRLPDNLGVAGWVLRENRPMIIPDVSKDSRFFDGFDTNGGFVTRSMICTPLRTRYGIIGVLCALNKLNGTFSDKELKLLEILAVPVSIALENAKLYGALKQHANTLEQENLKLKSQMNGRFDFQGVIGSSPSMHKLFVLLEKVIGAATTVLIQGETGTGKDLIAWTIHSNSPFKHKPFIAENCGALSENLSESELFGHVKGAFTGAIKDKKGIFEIANGGTVFLDELGEMPASMQVKLLRVLQDGQIRYVGSNKRKKVKFRLIASTNRNLEEEVKQGNFREDLFYRINIFPIYLPPLRERKEDIPLLTSHFIDLISKKLTRKPARITSGALEHLSQYDWPGNVRELQNEIERALTLIGEGDEIREEHLSEKIILSPENFSKFQDFSRNLQELKNQFEKRVVFETLRKTKGNRTHAARMLGLTRQGLHNKICRYNIKL